jgi:hypothetical protein
MSPLASTFVIRHFSTRPRRVPRTFLDRHQFQILKLPLHFFGLGNIFLPLLFI